MKDSGRSKRQKLKKLIAELKSQRAQLNNKVEQLETKLMTKCPHLIEALREAKAVSSSWSATPPMRVCTDCGYAEEGWHCGYWKLDTDYGVEIPKLSRDAAFKFVRKFWTQNAMAELRYPNRQTSNDLS